jgi:tetratricopeptide (TPR) repeat protein
MIDRPYRTAALAALLLFCCLALSASSALPARAADEELEPGIGDVPPSDRLPDGGDSEEGGQPPSGKDLTGPPPSSTPNKQDRSDILGNVPLGDPAVRAEMLKELYTQLSGARSAKDAEPIAEAIEETWRRSGSDTIDLLMTRVDAFVLAADLDLAMQVLDAVTELDPENAEAWHQRGIVHLMQNDTEQALADLKRAIAIDPNHYKALRDLGAALQQTGDQRGALDAYRKALVVNPFLEQARRAEEQLSHDVEGRDI